MQQCWLAATQGGQQPPATVCSLRHGSHWANATAVDKYLDWQCSPGYQSRLCTVCQDGYGSSGTQLFSSTPFWLTRCCCAL